MVVVSPYVFFGARLLLVNILCNCTAARSSRPASGFPSFSPLVSSHTVGAHPVDCCKPKPPIGPPRHEWERICPDLGCQSSDSETYTSESSAEESAVSSSTGGSTPTSASALSYWPLAVAALAASTALAAAIFGQRREQEGKHQLRGSVARRMEDFSSFADRTLADGGGGGKGVEMAPTTSATSSAGYRLA